MGRFSQVQFAGDYELTSLNLISYRSAEDNYGVPQKVDIRGLLVELNVFESIYSKSISGNIVVADGAGLIEDFPLTGLERLEFIFSTPGAPNDYVYNFTTEGGSPLYVYKVDSRKRTTGASQVYVLYFCSKEMLNNEKKRINYALDGTSEDIVYQIFRNEDLLNSKKKIYLEPSETLTRYLFPNVKPFTAIDMVAKQAVSANYKNAGFLFYETKSGYQFRSMESLLATGGTTVREPRMTYFVDTANVRHNENRIVENEMTSVISYEILNQFDTLKNLRGGAYASRLITHDAFNKLFSTYDYNYHIDYGAYFHTNGNKDGGRTSEGRLTPVTPSDDTGAYITQYPNARVYVNSYTQNLYNDFGRPNVVNITRQRIAQDQIFNNIVLSLQVPGNTMLDAGDKIYFEIPSVRGGNAKGTDRQLSGNYIITEIRNNVNISTDRHTTYLKVVRDCVENEYPSESFSTYVGTEYDNVDKVRSFGSKITSLFGNEVSDTYVNTLNNAKITAKNKIKKAAIDILKEEKDKIISKVKSFFS